MTRDCFLITFQTYWTAPRSRENCGSAHIFETQGKQSSAQIAAFGKYDPGWSMEQVVTSTYSESSAS